MCVQAYPGATNIAGNWNTYAPWLSSTLPRILVSPLACCGEQDPAPSRFVPGLFWRSRPPHVLRIRIRTLLCSFPVAAIYKLPEATFCCVGARRSPLAVGHLPSTLHSVICFVFAVSCMRESVVALSPHTLLSWLSWPPREVDPLLLLVIPTHQKDACSGDLIRGTTLQVLCSWFLAGQHSSGGLHVGGDNESRPGSFASHFVRYGESAFKRMFAFV